MRKQGAILLGNGGDNSNGSQGTFYEGAMTAPGTFPGDAVDQRVQANVVAAGYQVAMLALAPAGAVAVSPGLQTFAPRSSRQLRLSFTNTGSAPVSGVALSLALPRGWSAAAEGGLAIVQGSIAPGATAGITFNVTSAAVAFQGDIVGHASWKAADGTAGSARTVLKVRNASPVSINEFRVSAGTSANTTDSFIELYNAGAASVDISGWSLTQHAAQQATFSALKIPAGTRLAPRGFYLLGLANSGLVVPARAGDRTLHVRSVTGMSVGDTVEIDSGGSRELRRIAAVGTAATPATTLWQPLPEGPVIRVPAGSARVPVTSVAGFAVGERIALGHGTAYPAVGQAQERYEVATVTEVGKPGTQAWLTAEAKAGSTNLKVSSVANITAGDRIRLDIASKGHGIETVTVARVGTASTRNAFNGPLAEADLGTGLELAAPLQFNHSSNMPFSVHGTGIAFTPATSFAHASNEPVQALGTGITLDAPLAHAHAIDAVVRDAAVATAGYQGSPAPQLWFGGPALSASAGSMVLRDATGIVVDSLNYGLLVDPWMAEGYQATSGAGLAGCRVPVPAAGGGGFFAGPPAAFTPHRSAGRFPDGADTDSNCTDFQLQPATLLSVAAGAGATNIKVASIADLRPGQALTIDGGAERETAVIAAVGTAGATTVRVAAAAGATVVPVASAAGFATGQAVVLANGNVQEQAVVAATAGGGRGGANASITLAEPLRNAMPQGAQVAGTGLTLAAPLTHMHAGGVQVNAGLPTPGGPNQFERGNR
jgi:hypothetical protein